MQLNIKNPEATQLARSLAAETGETITQAITVALRERLASLQRRRSIAEREAAIAKIQARVAEKLARADVRVPSQAEMDEEDYDEIGLPR